LGELKNNLKRKHEEDEQQENKRRRDEMYHQEVHPYNPYRGPGDSPGDAAVESAKQSEEQMAQEAENQEIQKARETAYKNVTDLGGTPEEAEAAAEQAANAKARELGDERAQKAQEVREQLQNKMDPRAVEETAQHISLAHAGRNPTGNSLSEIENMHKQIMQKNKPKKKKPTYTIKQIIPDDVSAYEIQNATIMLPFPSPESARATSEEEMENKEQMAEARDETNNKITAEKPLNGLPAAALPEGHLNIGPNFNQLGKMKGKAYMTKEAYQMMQRQNMNTSGWVPKFAGENGPLPGSPEYYEADLDNATMQIPTPFSPSPGRIVTNGNETIDMTFASKMVLESGELQGIPMDQYIPRKSPRAFGSSEDDGETVQEKDVQKYKENEKRNNADEQATATVVGDVAEITPSFGTRTHKKVGQIPVDPVKQESDSEEMTFNAASESDSSDSGFYDPYDNDDKENNNDNENNNDMIGAENALTREKDPAMKAQEDRKLQEMKKPREGGTTADAVYNTMLSESEPIAKQTNMSQEDLLKGLEKLQPEDFDETAKFMEQLIREDQPHRLIPEAANLPVVAKLKNLFPKVDPITLFKIMAHFVCKVLNIPDRLNDTILFQGKANIPDLQNGVIKDSHTGTTYTPSNGQSSPVTDLIKETLSIPKAPGEVGVATMGTPVNNPVNAQGNAVP
ncbi:hypothetical protein ENBRE01_3356, partial [Enteropsectra breve]